MTDLLFPFATYWWAYAGFTVGVLCLLALDLGLLHRRAHVVSWRESLVWSAVWIGLALVFGAGLYRYAGAQFGTDVGGRIALEFLTGYIVERALSFDNISVFVLIFSYFGVPQKYHHRVLFWGVIGALITRALFIAAGAALITRFGWILYLFGLVLVVSGWKMLTQKNLEVHPDRNLFIRMARKFFPVSTGFETGAFFVRMNGVLHLTPLFLVLLTVETTDIVFAVDSIPAVFGVTQDPFIVFTSNIFAILGLRATYFLLAGMMESFP